MFSIKKLAGVAAIAALALLAPMTAAAKPAAKQVAKEVQSQALGKTVLASLKGRTLYSLSVEKHGKFICTGTCTATWHPLLVPAATKPKGPVALGTVKRPEGKTQVTYKGRPLYTFAGDSKPGDVNGEGSEGFFAVGVDGKLIKSAPSPAASTMAGY